MHADPIMLFFWGQTQPRAEGSETVDDGWKMQPILARHTHIFFNVLRFDRLVWGVRWIESPKCEAATQSQEDRRGSMRADERSCFGTVENMPEVSHHVFVGSTVGRRFWLHPWRDRMPTTELRVSRKHSVQKAACLLQCKPATAA